MKTGMSVFSHISHWEVIMVIIISLFLVRNLGSDFRELLRLEVAGMADLGARFLYSGSVL